MDVAFFKKHKTLFALIIATFALFLFSFALILWNFNRLAPSIVLHFDSFHGVDAFGTRASLWGIWILGIVVCLVNGGLVYEFYHRERFLSYLFLGANVLIALFALIIIGVITSIN